MNTGWLDWTGLDWDGMGWDGMGWDGGSVEEMGVLYVGCGWWMMDDEDSGQRIGQGSWSYVLTS